MKIRSKATLAGVIAVVLSIAISTVVVLLLIRAELTRQAHAYQNMKMKVFHELVHEQGEPKVADGKLMFGNYVVNGNYEIVDRLTRLAGGTATIFLGDTRISTNVMKDDGTRAIGTPLVGVAKEFAIDRGQPYRGEAEILGVPYFTAYDPLLNAEGKVYGVLYVGVKQQEFFQAFKHLMLTSVGIAIVLSLIIGAIVTYAVGRLLGRLAQLSKAADAVSIGEELDTPIRSSSNDEIGDLSKSIDRLRESMRAALSRLEG